ncbi:MAG TPA: disulfide reductase [Methanosarcinaceae archaeon]|nr:disulfide reductase [Methanosarcinaceae archaeon]HJH30994.1 disulfide reductase [Methanosarcinaceae archaeon]
MAEFSYYSGIPTFYMMIGIAMVAILIFLLGMYLNMQKWGGGSASHFLKTFIKSINHEKLGHHKRQSLLSTIILDILLQRRILRRSPFRWVMHMMIFVGWIGMFILSMVFAVFEMLHAINIGHFDLVVIRNSLDFSNEVLGYMLLIGLIIAIARRLVIPDVVKRTQIFDWVLVLGTLFITVTGFMAEGFRPDAITGAWTFLGDNVALAETFALFHVAISLLFCIAYIPYSKYMHMLAAPMVILVNGGGE